MTDTCLSVHMSKKERNALRDKRRGLKRKRRRQRKRKRRRWQPPSKPSVRPSDRCVYTVMIDLHNLAKKNPGLFRDNEAFFEKVLNNFYTVPDSDIEKTQELLNIKDCKFYVQGPSFVIIPRYSDNNLHVWCDVGRAGTERWVWIPNG